MAKKKKSFKEMTAFSSQSAAWILQNLPFVLFLGFLGTIYIANAHYAEKTVREIQTLQTEVKELRRVYNSLQAEIMYASKKSELEKSVEPLGLEISRRAPKKIVVPKEE